MQREVTIQCGRYIFDSATKKVTIVKSKGVLNLFLNDENELWVKWFNVDDNNKIEMERVLIKGSTIFEKVKGQHRVYILRFNDEDTKYFFWMQSSDSNQDESLCKQFNDVINQQNLDDQIEQPPQQQQQQIIEEPIQQPQQQPQQQLNLQQQLLQLLQQNMQSQQEGLALSDILSNEFLHQIAQDQEYFEALKQYLPEEQQNFEKFRENLLSPQFRQALESLTHALKGRERSAVISQLELDYRQLESEFDGVLAFVKAIIKKVNEEKRQQ